MPNRFVQKNGHTVEMLTRVPVNRGSLLKSIDHLLKTIETSENAVMIPTLLKDKVRVDACELLFVAKILKASILGHSDLVEFYMNHIGHTSSSLQTHAQNSPALMAGEPMSPTSIKSQQHQPQQQAQSPMASPLLTHAISNHQREQQQQAAAAAAAAVAAATAAAAAAAAAPDARGGAQSTSSLSSCSTSSSLNSQSSQGSQGSVSTALDVTLAAASSTTNNNSNNNNNNNATSLASASSTTSGSFSSSSSSGSDSSAGTTATTSTSAGGPLKQPDTPTLTLAGNILPAPEDPLAHEALAATANKPLPAGRQAQPPSLLQLTTTNNHINSMSDMFQGANHQLSPSLEQLTNQLVSLQQQSGAQLPASASPTPPSRTFEGLSISTAPASAGSLEQFGHATPPSSANGPGTPPTPRQELRSSRSAGCLFRNPNSGATSPRTPNQTTPSTPLPQAETLAGATGSNGLVGEPSSLVKLLLQVEQLKTSISHCTMLLESVVELYKKSIDNIA